MSVIDDVTAARARQQALDGQQDYADGTGPEVLWGRTDIARHVAMHAQHECLGRLTQGRATWLDILHADTAEAFAQDDPAKLRAALIRVAVDAVAWAEAIDRRGGAPS
ncbi:hypothetical protein DQ384_26100 [Sphaerisporangium album]|uniref:Uncharacterized protein n=1 Tax=Sphaerisporangium album TaxID=509200 RepID=A0A367FBY1_9ACTN|nr:hypothetical protein [Sphaerisporangium album]RCG27195.1 hypothetical protein DQ384_26100 [Sphaerisporangium album]